MARPQGEGLSYFPLDTDINIDDKIFYIEAKHGLIGFAIIIKLFMKIYKNSYYCPWGDKELLIFSKQISIAEDTIQNVVDDALQENLFNQNLYLKYKILTSNGIQKRYFEAGKRRKKIIAFSEYIVTDLSVYTNIVLTSINATSCNNNIVSSNHNVTFTPQSKVEEIESKVNQIESKAEESKQYDGADQKEDAASLPDAVPVCIKVLDYFSLKSGVLTPSPKDIELANDLSMTITYEIIVQGIDETFEKYKPKRKGDRINSLKYCEGRIRDLWETEKAKEAVKGGGDQQDNRKLPDEPEGESDEELNPADFGLV